LEVPAPRTFEKSKAKERIDEMDATLASLEAKSSQVQVDFKVKALQLIADLRKRRDEFRARAARGSKPSLATTSPQYGFLCKFQEAQ
jgi:hypothetical protein